MGYSTSRFKRNGNKKKMLNRKLIVKKIINFCKRSSVYRHAGKKDHMQCTRLSLLNDRHSGSLGIGPKP